MDIHQNARTTPRSRAEIVRRVRSGEGVNQVATAVGVSERTVRKWVAREEAAGTAGLADRSCRPHRSPTVTRPALVSLITQLRQQRWTGRQIAAALQLSDSTVARYLRRCGLARLRSGEPTVAPIRYQWPVPGDMVHLDVKKLGRIGRVGHRITGDRRARVRGIGWEFVHVAVDDASRLAYVEVLPDKGGVTTTKFLWRALGWFRRHGIHVRRLLTDNGNGYVSDRFARLCRSAGVRHRRTRPYTPRTNGKAERFIQTLLREWAYRRPYSSSAGRRDALPARLAVLLQLAARPWGPSWLLTLHRTGGHGDEQSPGSSQLARDRILVGQTSRRRP
jgi:transposase InsO family protein